MSTKSELPPGARALTFYDPELPNIVRVVEYNGTVYIEAQGKHHGEVVYTLVKVDRLQFLPLMLGWTQ